MLKFNLILLHKNVLLKYGEKIRKNLFVCPNPSVPIDYGFPIPTVKIRLKACIIASHSKKNLKEVNPGVVGFCEGGDFLSEPKQLSIKNYPMIGK